MGKRSKLVALLVVICMVATLLPVTSMEEYEASEKISSELLELLGVTYEELISGEFVDLGETYSCIIWIQDVEIEKAVEAGIDAAEATREEYSAGYRYDYPYSTYELEHATYVDVELNDNESDEYVQTYIETEREAAAELYATNNAEFVTQNFRARDMSVNYVSKYSPCVFADLNVTKISELVNMDDVTYVGYWIEPEVGGEATLDMSTSGMISAESLATNLEAVNVDEAHEKYNVLGEGIKIGQIESACPEIDSVIVNPSYNNTLILGKESNHSENVYNIMHAIAPNAEYYATGMYVNNTSSQYGDYHAQIEWLLDQGVNIINQSARVPIEEIGNAPDYNYVNEYTEYTRWIDHIAFNHDVHFVVSSGNITRSGVLPPGMGYNVITVGSVYENDESFYELNDFSSYCYLPPSISEGRTYKPDMVAPGCFGNISGTSFSAPMVTGTIALMCEYQPSLKTKQFVVKSILAASTGKETGRYVTEDTFIFRRYGAGVLDARAALWIIYKGNYSTSTAVLTSVGDSKTYNMSVTSSDTSMRVALSYGNRTKYSDDEHLVSDTPEGLIGEVKLEVYNPDGVCVASCTVKGANLKIVQFDPRENGGTGTYKIKITVVEAASDGRTTSCGVAWR